MNTKLTLNIDQSVIEEAKFYAKNNSVSLSKLIENYLFFYHFPVCFFIVTANVPTLGVSCELRNCLFSVKDKISCET